MSSSEQQIEFANYILEHPARNDVIDSIALKLLRSFQKGNPEIRVQAANTLDSLELFFGELHAIRTNSLDINNAGEE